MQRVSIICTVLAAILVCESNGLAQPARREFYQKSTNSFFNPQTVVAQKGRRAAKEIIDRLKAPGGINDNMVYSAIQQLALTGHPEVGPLLERYLKKNMVSPKWQLSVRQAAVTGLVQLNTPQSRKALAAAFSIPALKNNYADMVEHCGMLRATECAPAIVAYIEREKRYNDDSLINLAQCSPKLAVELVEKQLAARKYKKLYDYEILALGVAGPPAASLLIEHAKQYTKRRWSGEKSTNLAWALGQIKDKRALPVLRKIVQTDDHMAVYFAALSLAGYKDKSSIGLIKQAAESKFKKDVVYAHDGEDSDWGSFRRERIRRLEYDLGLLFARASLGEKVARKKIVAASKSKDAAYAMLADSFLLRLGDRTAARRLAARVKKEAASAYSAVASDMMWNQSLADGLRALAEYDLLEGLQVFALLAGAGHWQYKARGKRLLYRVPRKQRIRALVASLNQAGYTQRAEVKDSLRQTGDAILTELNRQVKNFDLAGRVLAANLLGEFDDPAGKKTLAGLAKSDPVWQVRRAARAALALRQNEDFPKRPKLQTKVQRFVAYSEEDKLPKNPLSAVEYKNKIFVAGQDSLRSYDGYQWREVKAKGLCDQQVTTLAVLKGKLVAFSKNGVAKGDGARFSCMPSKLPVVHLAAADKGGLLLGTQKGLYRYNGKRAALVKGSPLRKVTALARQGKTIWVGFSLPQISVTIRYTPTLSKHMIPSSIEPALYKLQKGRFIPVVEPMLAFEGWRLPMDVHSLAAGPKNTFFVGCTEGILAYDGRRWNLLDDTNGYDPRYPVDTIHVSKDGTLTALQGAWIDQRDRKGRWHRARLAKEGMDAGLLMAQRPASSFIRSNGDSWMVAGDFYQYSHRMMPGVVVRLAGIRQPQRRLPPETLIVMAKAGEWRWENPETQVRPPNRVRLSGKPKPIEIPAAQASIEAAAQDPWDYEAVSFQFKFDEEPWTKWQKGNGILTPLMGEGEHILRVRSKDESGNVDPSPAVLHFSVHTRELAVVRINGGKFKSVFPAQYRRYEREGIGTVEIENRATEPMQIEINMKVRDMFDTPATRSLTIPASSSKKVSLTAPFNQKVLALSGGGEVQAVVEVEFEFEGIRRQVRRSFPLKIQPANAFDWNDPSRLAGFINSADPAVARFGSEVFRAFSAGAGAKILPMRNLSLAAYMFGALHAWGVRYKTDPKSPFSSVKPGSVSVIDTVRFPSQTLAQKVGDCDDLVVLYTSLLEQVGIPTVVVPVEGHVFLMFDSGVLEANRAAFKVPDTLLVKREGSLWVPVEITWLGRKGATFEQAWSAGAEGYKSKYRPSPDSLVDVRIAWATTPPVTFLKAQTLKLSQAIAKAGAPEVEGLLNGYQQAVLDQAVQGDDPKALLERGRLLAKNGFFEKAEAVLSKAQAKQPCFEAAYSLGVVYAGKRKTNRAITSFNNANKLSKDNQQRFRAAIALATTYRSTGSLKKAKVACDQAMKFNPAARFDSKYSSLIRFLRSSEKTKAASEQGPPPFYQLMLSQM